MKNLICIVGPTGAGKTSLGISLSRRFNGEIVSADSRQVYRFMDLGTGKATASEQKAVRHHLIDIVNPDETFSVYDFVVRAVPAIETIWSRGNQPFVVGGTGLYVKALLSKMEGIMVPQDPELRKQLATLSVRELGEELERLDPKKYVLIDRNNPRRLIRAIEIARSTEVRDVPHLLYDKVLSIGLTAPNEVLYERSDRRIEEIVYKGLLDEVKMLLSKGYDWSLPSMSSVWYLPFRDYLEQRVTLEYAVQKVKFETHAYIRRQNTWFRKQKGIAWFDVSQRDYEKEVLVKVEDFLR